ncbi:short-chain dehydrogenase/reductase SDR [Thecamonas trahens ATCC 50062]|uniref:Peroxisomal trans-2-enoyl-CoA reductase n=1 Tax=Thecamonas trahens ATCC 50062 TaxID=461836 RepID=A0A0L0DL64_THETB|nr:short-chain dehydrogenase/reductase SDR [Thecamonas trahens ATCC 50062]KNC53059.1 short-chain dehydrogenase/reductase SDR [Thecamonas trahens ATCC 50062]|eukprot:XP_013754735.1 short-chain dehydrogenase/reductase SDR [Thecamonas trahens ATCC 50062]
MVGRGSSVYANDVLGGEVVLVTGGGSGIGLATAWAAVAGGAAGVAIAGRKGHRLEAAAEVLVERGEAEGYDCRILPVVMDIRHLASVESGIATVIDVFGRIDVVVNNAGGQYVSPAEDISPKGWRAVVDTNLTGTWNVLVGVFAALDAAAPDKAALRGLRCVNVVADMWAGMPHMAHSGAARAGVVNLTHTLAVEWARYGIRINAVAPGIIVSSGLDSYPAPVRAALPSIAAACPTGRGGTESEVAAAIIFLASSGASYVNGAVLRVDGGSSLRKGIELSSFFPPHPAIPPYHSAPFLADKYGAFIQASRL